MNKQYKNTLNYIKKQYLQLLNGGMDDIDNSTDYLLEDLIDYLLNNKFNQYALENYIRSKINEHEQSSIDEKIKLIPVFLIELVLNPIKLYINIKKPVVYSINIKNSQDFRVIKNKYMEEKQIFNESNYYIFCLIRLNKNTDYLKQFKTGFKIIETTNFNIKTIIKELQKNEILKDYILSIDKLEKINKKFYTAIAYVEFNKHFLENPIAK